AFQVTFMALARQAARLKREPLAGWLHRVARRTALNTADSTRRRQKLEQQPLAAVRSTEGDVSRTEMQAVIDEGLANLPEKLRVPLVLRYLEEKTQEEVARILGCSRSVALRRLARGETLLRERLERRGLAGGIGSITVLLGCKDGIPAVPGRLIEST